MIAFPAQPQAPRTTTLTSVVTALGPRNDSQARRAAAIGLRMAGLPETALCLDLPLHENSVGF